MTTKTIPRILRRWHRAMLAYYFPMRFAKWVNRDRCGIGIMNDPSGRWHVRLGLHNRGHGQTLNEAMLEAFWQCELDPGWRWACDYLREL